MNAFLDKSVIERRIERLPWSGCWIWSSSGKVGYGNIRVNGHMEAAHRAVWEAYHGNIPAGVWVLHHCDIRCCVNPEHLFLGNAKNNTQDMLRKGRGVSAQHQFCQRGHLIEWVSHAGRRMCRLCKNEHNKLYMRRYTARKKLENR